MWAPHDRYPDKRIQSFDPRFDRLWHYSAAVERLYTGTRWGEGPVWFGDTRQLLWSDIPNNRILRWDEETGSVSEFRRPSNYANGATRDNAGRLISCEHLTRRVTRTDYNGAITVIADSHDGKRLNSPNDVIVKSDGSIWFTDPPFGIAGFHEGEKGVSELPPATYRWDPQTGATRIVAGDIAGPNGLAFSPDESVLYIVESRSLPHRRILAYDVQPDQSLTNKRVFVDCGPGTPDGIRCDVEGNLWCGWGMGSDELDGVHVFAPDGTLIGRIALPERCANLCFGGRHGNRLFMASSTSLYSLITNTQGAHWR